MFKRILIPVLVLLCSVGYGQTYNPSLGTTSNKSYAPAQAVSTDFRTLFYDASNFVQRPYQNTTEVLTYLNLSKYRTGQFDIVVNTGGVLSNGVITGGTNEIWFFKNGTADSNLVRKIPTSSGGCTGCLLSANNLSDLASITAAKTNLGLGTMASQNIAAGGDLSGNWPNPTVAMFNGQLPSYYLNYNNLFNTPVVPAPFNPIAGTGISLSGSYPNITFSASAGSGFTTAGTYLTSTGGGSIVNLDTLNYRKVDTLQNPNDSTLIYTLNGQSHTLILRGGVHGSGPGAGSVTSVSVVTANGVSGTVANPTSTPAITLTLGNITPTTVNGLTFAAITGGATITGGSGTPHTLTFTANANVAGTNTGDVTKTGENYLSLSGQALTANAVDVSGTNITGILKAASFPALTGDVTTSASSLATSIAANAVTYAKVQQMPTLTVLGNPTGSTATPQAITLGTGLSITGTTLSAAGPTLNNTQVGVGNGSNQVSGSSSLTYTTGSGLNYNTSFYLFSDISKVNGFVGGLAPPTSATGTGNFGAGEFVLQSLSSGNNNTAIGHQALRNLTAGVNNAAIGVSALTALTIGNSNMAMGVSALGSTTTGSANLGIGSSALSNSITGSFNVGLGFQAFTNLTRGNGNTGIGYTSGFSTVTSFGSTFIGDSTAYNDTLSLYSTVIGTNALIGAKIIDRTIAIGSGSGAMNARYDSLILIGNGVGKTTAAAGVRFYNTTIVGNNITSDTSNLAIFGNSSQRVILGNGGGGTGLMNTLSGYTSALFYNTDSAAYCYYNGIQWIKVGSGSSGSGGTYLKDTTLTATVSTGSTYTNSALINAPILGLFVNGSRVSTSVVTGQVYATFTASTGSFALTNGSFTSGDNVVVLYQVTATGGGGGGGGGGGISNYDSAIVTLYQIDSVTVAFLKKNRAIPADTLKLNALAGPNFTLTTTGSSGPATLTGTVLNIPQYTGGGSTLLTRQSITSGTSATGTSGGLLVKFNFTSTASTFTFTMPASPTDQQVVEFEGGGTLTSGTEVTSLTVSPNSGQTIIGSVALTTFTVGEYAKYRYDSTLAIWYREN